jgi:hypothetical protein
MMKSVRILAIACGLLVAATLQAQRPKSAAKVVPPELRPPAGMCRIWLDGVPPGRQPAPTDCASALRNRPAKGQVIFGDDYAHLDSSRRGRDQRSADTPLKGVAPLPKSMEPKDSVAADSAATGKKADDAHKKGDGRKVGTHRPDSTRSGGSLSSVVRPGG